MAKEPRRGLSSTFDELISANRDQLDSRMRGVWGGGSATTDSGHPHPRFQVPPVADPPPVVSQRPVTSPDSPLRQEGEYQSASQVWDAAKSDIARRLNERFGSEWEM